jgi:hypothetical protein
VRGLAQGVFPALLASAGLAVAIQAMSEESATPLELTAITAERFAPEVEAAAYFMVAEALRATPGGRVTVGATRRGGHLVVEVETEAAAATPELEDRVGAVDGSLLTLPRPDGRVRLQAEIPCAS